MTHALDAESLGKRYGRTWALHDCTLELPAGRVAALIGPNGAGKSTLLNLAVGLTEPTAGAVSVFGASPRRDAATVLPRIGFVGQDRPLYRGLTVAETMRAGRVLNPRWDAAYADDRMRRLGIPLDRKVGKLSGGQHSQVALVMALAKRPELMILDEPVAALDPLARREFLQILMEAVAADGMTVLLSSHIVGDLERVCDHLILMAEGEVQFAGELDRFGTTHRLLVGPRSDPAAVARVHHVVQERHTDRQTTLLVRANGHVYDACWEVREVGFEEIVLGYLDRGRRDAAAAREAQPREEIPA